MARYPAAQWKPIGSGGTVRMARYDLLVIHTMVGSLVGTDRYFRTQPNNSHFGLGGKWGPDQATGLDGKLYQWVDTAFRSAATKEGNGRCVAVECADNAPASPADIQPFTPAQCDALVDLMVWAHRTHGIPLVAARDSKPGTVGIGYHRLGCDPYRVADGELWSAAYGKVCPGDARIAQIPDLIARAQRVAAGGSDTDWLEGLMADFYTDRAAFEKAVEQAAQRGVRTELTAVGGPSRVALRSLAEMGATDAVGVAIAAVQADTRLQGDDEAKVLAKLAEVQKDVEALAPAPAPAGFGDPTPEA